MVIIKSIEGTFLSFSCLFSLFFNILTPVNRLFKFRTNREGRHQHHDVCLLQPRLGFGCKRVSDACRATRVDTSSACLHAVFAPCIFVCLLALIQLLLPIRNVAKMEDAKVEIDDGKDETVLPDTMYQ